MGGTECPDGAPTAGLAAPWPWSRVAAFLSWPWLSLSSPVVPQHRAGCGFSPLGSSRKALWCCCGPGWWWPSVPLSRVLSPLPSRVLRRHRRRDRPARCCVSSESLLYAAASGFVPLCRWIQAAKGSWPGSPGEETRPLLGSRWVWTQGRGEGPCAFPGGQLTFGKAAQLSGTWLLQRRGRETRTPRC